MLEIHKADGSVVRWTGWKDGCDLEGNWVEGRLKVSECDCISNFLEVDGSFVSPKRVKGHEQRSIKQHFSFCSDCFWLRSPVHSSDGSLPLGSGSGGLDPWHWSTGPGSRCNETGKHESSRLGCLAISGWT